MYIKKVQSCQNNTEKSYTQKQARHEPSGGTMFIKCSFDEKENKLNYYREKDCIEKLCKKLKDRVMKIVYYKKVRDHFHHTEKFRGAAHSECNLRYNVSKEIPVIIHNAGYDTDFIINQLAIEFKEELNCIGDNMEKYITFSVPIKKELNNGKTVTHKLKFIDWYRFMQSSLSDLVDNMSVIFKSKECISCRERKKINSECHFVGLKNDRLIYKCKECKKEQKEPIKKLTKNFPGIFRFCNGDLNKFILLLRKGVYPYEYMDSWEKFDENTLPP